MSHPPRQAVIVGNWKMYKTIAESLGYIKELLPLVRDLSAPVYLAAPFTSIKPLADLCRNTIVLVGGQNMHDAEEGAFTGEIAGRMLKEAGATFVILGHSERRRYFGESNEFINKKVKRALAVGLKVVLCIGETASEREDGTTENVLSYQLNLGLAGVTPDQAKEVSIAYEPVWAIGTSKVATPETAEHVHSFCRNQLAEQFGQAIANHMPILYGGSVNADNAQALFDQPDVDGLLVGTASLDLHAFSKILHCAAQKNLKLNR